MSNEVFCYHNNKIRVEVGVLIHLTENDYN